MPIEGRLVSAELHPIASPLDHAVTPPDEDVAGVSLLANNVAGSVPTGLACVDQEGLRCPFRQIPIADHHRAAGDDELALLAKHDIPSLLVDHPRAVIL